MICENILEVCSILETEQEGHDGPGVGPGAAHLSLLTKHNQFPTSCEIYVLPNNTILNSSV